MTVSQACIIRENTLVWWNRISLIWNQLPFLMVATNVTEDEKLKKGGRLITSLGEIRGLFDLCKNII